MYVAAAVLDSTPLCYSEAGRPVSSVVRRIISSQYMQHSRLIFYYVEVLWEQTGDDLQFSSTRNQDQIHLADRHYLEIIQFLPSYSLWSQSYNFHYSSPFHFTTSSFKSTYLSLIFLFNFVYFHLMFSYNGYNGRIQEYSDIDPIC